MATIAHHTGERLEKLLRLAFDTGATEGEATSAATQAVLHARREKITFSDVVQTIAPASRQLPPPRKSGEPAALKVVMPFGKYGGDTLAEIAEDDLAYIEWAAKTFKRGALRNALRATLEYYTSEDQR